MKRVVQCKIETPESKGFFFIVHDLKFKVESSQEWEILVGSLEEYYLWSRQQSDISDDNLERSEHSEPLEDFGEWLLAATTYQAIF